MTGSINQPAAITEKFVQKYGTIWANIDFVMNDVYESQFKTDPMEMKVGTLYVDNAKIVFKYKYLITEVTRLRQILAGMYESNPTKDQKFHFSVANKEFILRKHEINKIVETLEDALHTIQRTYQLGLYL
jgi:hypothetical protein